MVVPIIFMAFGPAVKKAEAAVGPAALALTLFLGSLAVHLGMEMGQGTFKGLHDTLPPKIIKGPHRVSNADTYWCEDTGGKKYVWDKRLGRWLQKKEWELLCNRGKEARCLMPAH